MHTTGLGATDLQDRLPPVFPLDPLLSTIAGNGWSPVRQTGLPGPLRTGTKWPPQSAGEAATRLAWGRPWTGGPLPRSFPWQVDGFQGHTVSMSPEEEFVCQVVQRP